MYILPHTCNKVVTHVIKCLILKLQIQEDCVRSLLSLFTKLNVEKIIAQLKKYPSPICSFN